MKIKGMRKYRRGTENGGKEYVKEGKKKKWEDNGQEKKKVRGR